MYYFIILAIIVLISITCLKNSVAKKGILVVVFIAAIIGGILGGIIEGAIIRTSGIKAENITTTSDFRPFVTDSVMTEDCIIREGKGGIFEDKYSLSDIRGGEGLEHKIIIVNDSLQPGILTVKKTLAHRVLPGIPSFKMTLESKNYVVLPKKQYEVFKTIENHAREREDSLAKAKESV
jgi:hypothetical protein